MKLSEKRRERVVEVRQATVSALARHGKFEDLGGMKAMTCTLGNVMVMYRTPFQKAAAPKSAPDYDMALMRQHQEAESFGYGLDIWASHKKVLNIEWQDDRMRVASYRPGDWEDQLAAA